MVAGEGAVDANSAPSIAGFGGVVRPAGRPAAAVAATGLDTATLLFQRVLSMCAIQRDFGCGCVVGATLSTIADGNATGARESRRTGVEPSVVPAEAVLCGVGLLGAEGDDLTGGDGGGGGGSSSSSSSSGNTVLPGQQAMVRLYLMQMLLIVTRGGGEQRRASRSERRNIW